MIALPLFSFGQRLKYLMERLKLPKGARSRLHQASTRIALDSLTWAVKRFPEESRALAIDEILSEIPNHEHILAAFQDLPNVLGPLFKKEHEEAVTLVMQACRKTLARQKTGKSAYVGLN